jgi:hypothetical protein
MTRQPQRKVYLVDHEVQGGLLHKAAWYWLLSLAVVGSLNVVGWIFVAPGVDVLVQIRELLPSFFGVLFVAMVSSLIVLPALLHDLAKHTNRFAGPVFRLQRSLKALAEGKTIQPLSFRDGDYWHDLAEAFNQVAARLETAEAAARCQPTDEFQPYDPADHEETSATL